MRSRWENDIKIYLRDIDHEVCELKWTGLLSCPIVGFGISGFESLDYVTWEDDSDNRQTGPTILYALQTTMGAWHSSHLQSSDTTSKRNVG